MYYKTQIQSTGKGYAFDTQGKKLFFIGNFPCQAGDFVYTDGKYIFGNLSPKAQPIIFPVQGGIPVLAYDLRGYFDSNGNFKIYPIAGNDYGIVNNEKYYKHGDNFVVPDDFVGSIADIEISESGEVLIAMYDGEKYDDCTSVTIFKDGESVKHIDAKDYISDEEGTENLFVAIKGFKLFPDLNWTMILAAVIDGSTEIPDACPDF